MCNAIVSSVWEIADAVLRDVSPAPPRRKLNAIVAFLDRKLEQVDRFIAAKQRLIALLQEQKIALINRGVTKGLNPDAPMKHSGIGPKGS